VKRSVSIAMARALRYCVVLVGSAAVSLVAQVPDPLFKLDAASRFAVDATVDSAKALGLPWKFLLLRAQEGIAKGVDGRRISTAVKARFASLKDARAVLGNVSDQELNAAAALLETPGGRVRPEQLAPLKNQPKGRSLVSALTVLGDLVTKGIPGEEASSAIVKLWQGGAGDADFMGLFRNVESDILQGLNPGTALQNRTRESLGPSGKIPPSAGEPETPSP
jgi:hypothetical protein